MLINNVSLFISAPTTFNRRRNSSKRKSSVADKFVKKEEDFPAILEKRIETLRDRLKFDKLTDVEKRAIFLKIKKYENSLKILK